MPLAALHPKTTAMQISCELIALESRRYLVFDQCRKFLSLSRIEDRLHVGFTGLVDNGGPGASRRNSNLPWQSYTHGKPTCKGWVHSQFFREPHVDVTLRKP